MAKRKARDFFEPWEARKDTAWEARVRSPLAEGVDPGVVERWHADKARAEKNADWHVWGSRMWKPSLMSTVDGQPSVSWDTRHIVAKVTKLATEHENPPSHEDVARRIAECVNACQGVADPVDAMARARSLLLDMVNGK